MPEPPPAPSGPYQFNAWGKATSFGGQSDLEKFQACKELHKTDEECFGAPWFGDNGVGTKALGGVRTTYTYGAAVPTSELEKQFGPMKNPDGTINEANAAKARAARAQVTLADGRTVLLPLVDQGPAENLYKDPHQNRVADLTEQTQKTWGINDPHVKISVLPNAGPDYNKDKDGFYTDQQRIYDQLTAGVQNAPPRIGAEPSPTPSWVQPGAPPAPAPRAEPVDQGVGSPTPSWMQSGMPRVPRAEQVTPAAQPTADETEPESSATVMAHPYNLSAINA